VTTDYRGICIEAKERISVVVVVWCCSDRIDQRRRSTVVLLRIL